MQHLRKWGSWQWDALYCTMHCPVFQQDRNFFLPTIVNEKMQKNFIKLLTSENIRILRGLAKFLNILFGVFI